MANVSLKAAKASFSELVDEAAAGEFVTITRDGMPAAVLVSVQAAEEAKRAMARPRKSFADLLLAFPGGIEFERDQTPIRDIDF
ncbi:type II toxin-antitoxin system Phd/YefM family antitoxin [Rhizobium sp. SG2393]|uniref:type II toxin-antitoxin system Phd/YefM family antitoxin n=1 Tax=Rhizobium sp. SG2393 TaxID=3276279 RepID=UPI0036702343